MTRKSRRDVDTKNGSPISGLRMEPLLADRLTDAARADAERRGEISYTGRGIANIARETRIILRAMLYSDGNRKLGHDDPPPGGRAPLCAGLKADPKLREAVLRYWHNVHPRLGVSGCIRHALRVALGWSEVDSLEVEQKFASIAEAKRALQRE